jgi:hypothetical protein
MKKPSPSTLRKNRKRMQEFIEKKKSSNNDTASAEATGESSKLPPGKPHKNVHLVNHQMCTWYIRTTLKRTTSVKSVASKPNANVD